MTDIVERLQRAKDVTYAGYDRRELVSEAAAEIERLRASIEEGAKAMYQAGTIAGEHLKEIGRLRAALKPFATAAKTAAGGRTVYDDKYHVGFGLYMGDLRSARATLNGGKP